MQILEMGYLEWVMLPWYTNVQSQKLFCTKLILFSFEQLLITKTIESYYRLHKNHSPGGDVNVTSRYRFISLSSKTSNMMFSRLRSDGLNHVTQSMWLCDPSGHLIAKSVPNQNLDVSRNPSWMVSRHSLKFDWRFSREQDVWLFTSNIKLTKMVHN